MFERKAARDCRWEACWLQGRCARPDACSAPSRDPIPQLAARLTGAAEGAPPAETGHPVGGAHSHSRFTVAVAMTPTVFPADAAVVLPPPPSGRVGGLFSAMGTRR